MPKDPKVLSAIGWSRVHQRTAQTLGGLLRSQPGEKRVIRLDLRIDVQGHPHRGSFRAKGTVQPVGTVRRGYDPK